MGFVPKQTKQKVPATYKTLYIKDVYVRKIERIAKSNATSFNNVVVSMIEECLKDENLK